MVCSLRWYCSLLHPPLVLQSTPDVLYTCQGLPLRWSTPYCGIHPAGVNILGCSLSLPCSTPGIGLLMTIVLFSRGLSLVWSAPYDGTAFSCTLQWCCSLPLTWYTPVRGYHCGGLLLAVIYTLQESPSWDVLSLPCCAPVVGLLLAFF